MASSSNFTVAERLMSLKASALSVFCAGIVSLTLLLLHRWSVVGSFPSLPGLFISLTNLTLLVNGAIATLSISWISPFG